MPKLKVFVVRDSKAEAYLNPFFTRTVGEALRMWDTTVNNGESQMGKYPEDFDLYESAEYDEDTGKFTQLEALRHLGKAVEVKRQQHSA